MCASRSKSRCGTGGWSWSCSMRSAVRWSTRMFRGFATQFPDYGEAQRAIAYQRLERMDHELEGREFVAGNRFTIADITALVAIDVAGILGDIRIAPTLRNLSRWHQTVSSRPSAKA